MACLEKSKNIFVEREPNSLELASVYKYRGIVLANEGNAPGAEVEFKESLALYEKHAPESLDAAHVYVLYSNYDKKQALKWLQKSQAIYKNLAPEDLKLGRVYHLIGNIYQGQGKLEESLDFFQKSLSFYEAASWTPEIAQRMSEIHGNIANIYSQQEKFSESIAANLRSISNSAKEIGWDLGRFIMNPFVEFYDIFKES